MKISIKKMIADSVNFLLEHILFWIGIILIGQSVIMGMQIFASMFDVYYFSSNRFLQFLFSLSGTGIGQETWQPILDFLHPFLPKWTIIMNDDSALFLNLCVSLTSLHFVFLLYLCAYSYFEYGTIIGYALSHKLNQKLTKYDYMKASRVIGLCILMFFTVKFVECLVPNTLQIYATRLIFGVALYYAYYRFWFVMPQIVAGNDCISSIKYSWNATWSLGLNGVLAFMVSVVAKYVLVNVPDVIRFYISLDYGWTYIIQLLYENLVFVFLVLFDFAAWRQMCDHKDVIAAEEEVHRIC